MKRATQNPSSTNTPTRVSMRRGKKYCSIVRPYINLLATIEQIVFNLSEKNIDASVEQIMKLFDTNTPYSFNIIINNLIYNVFHSRQNFADLYLKYIKLIQIKEEKLCKNNLNITNCFFEYVSQKKSQEAFYLIKKMYDTNFIDTNIIKTVISKYVSDYKKVIYDILKHDSMCVENYQERRKEAWKKKKELFLEGTNQNEIGKIIQNDEIEKLQEISSQTNFDFNKRILLLPPIGELYGYEFINHNIVRLIDYAAFFGSVKCFKYLLLNGSDSYNAGKYAVASGNEEIIHLCEQNHSSFKESYEAAIEFHRNDIFKYIYEKNLEKFDDKNINNLARLCIKYENYVILSFLNKKGFKIDDSIINESSRNGNLYLVKYYLQYSEIPKESLILSTKANNIELVKFIIDQEGFFNTKNI